MAPMSDDEFAELQRLVDHADLLHAEINAMSESEVVRTHDANGLDRLGALIEQLRVEREAIAEYATAHETPPDVTPRP